MVAQIEIISYSNYADYLRVPLGGFSTLEEINQSCPAEMLPDSTIAISIHQFHPHDTLRVSLAELRLYQLHADSLSHLQLHSRCGSLFVAKSFSYKVGEDEAYIRGLLFVK